MAKGRLFSPLIVAVLILASFLVYINLPNDEEKKKSKPKPTPVKVAKVLSQPLPIVIEALGTAIANESVTITAQETKIVTELAFNDGDSVSKGQLLVQFDDREEMARVNELDVSLSEAVRQYERIKNLRKESAASEQLLDEQDARVKGLQAQIDVAHSQVSELRVNAPFGGQLGVRSVSVGSLVQPGDVITTLDDVSLIKVDFSVSETHLASLQLGQRVSATSVAYSSEVFEGSIASIGSRVDPVTRSVQVRAVIDNADRKLRPGMLLQVLLEKRVLQALLIPEKALVPQEDKQFVYVLNGDKVSKTQIQIGARKPGSVQILDGLSEGQTVVVEGTLRVRDESTVRVLNTDGE
ncbi:efflux RND transporter periplasmic adaptor subunit [Alteromonas sp. 5E99-2]|uniref:efflux RND transporter periplasmic adaptor subunit n=1 Tax=Alteromonas sp. 5E99-2 TaxID=2817683 RepID=UPI001A995779|nr:efflux RND transporter periplasmic adaptor subunit [Alteromonas sp. 5E99-2]MBO1257014.1 efflux RND transporter periplasmic adaptor subunit [Alteromonas sp. 5E99-2]